MSLKNIILDKGWTIFLDRDGVINKRLPGDYVKSWKEFEFIPGVIKSFEIFSEIFGEIIIVTNQQGIGKKIMDEKDLQRIHSRMAQEIEKGKGRISKIYHSPYLASENHNSRKPNTGMADLAVKDFPHIDFKRTIMAGDSEKDMIFGKKKGMITVFIRSEHEEIPDDSLVDQYFDSLIDFANSLKNKQ